MNFYQILDEEAMMKEAVLLFLLKIYYAIIMQQGECQKALKKETCLMLFLGKYGKVK